MIILTNTATTPPTPFAVIVPRDNHAHTVAAIATAATDNNVPLERVAQIKVRIY